MIKVKMASLECLIFLNCKSSNFGYSTNHTHESTFKNIILITKKIIMASIKIIWLAK